MDEKISPVVPVRRGYCFPGLFSSPKDKHGVSKQFFRTLPISVDNRDSGYSNFRDFGDCDP